MRRGADIWCSQLGNETMEWGKRSEWEWQVGRKGLVILSWGRERISGYICVFLSCPLRLALNVHYPPPCEMVDFHVDQRTIHLERVLDSDIFTSGEHSKTTQDLNMTCPRQTVWPDYKSFIGVVETCMRTDGMRARRGLKEDKMTTEEKTGQGLFLSLISLFTWFSPFSPRKAKAKLRWHIFSLSLFTCLFLQLVFYLWVSHPFLWPSLILKKVNV